uniref:C2HC zinc finger plants domain-containing protein n=2 Tax=Musa acuminata subsp. malaccensis TaxID=214687 RepID=A0A804HW82_MUSAM
MRSGGGEQAVLETLQRARELYRNRLQANTSVDELASLFAECAIAEAQPMVANNLSPPHTASPTPILLDSDETSILSMTGRKQIMLDAFADGSSFVCLQCGGLVSSLRRDEHMAYWCG